jgi:tol-pal system protein YbgF
MRIRNALWAGAAVAGLLAGSAAAQDQSLADIRQKLSILYVEIESLRGELTLSGQATTSITGNSSLERLDAIEAELQRLTSKTEELEFRINRVTVDGTNRIGDLEFRLCELEPGCDIGLLGDTPSLGGVDSAANIPSPQGPPAEGGPQLALSEQIEFDAAQQKLVDGDFQGAADGFTLFVQAYPAGPLTSEAYYLRGQALEALGEISAAARSYLDGFSGDPEGPIAPDALFKLGMSLAALGQVADACVTLAEVPNRFPDSEAVFEAQTVMTNLGCS